MAVCDSTTTKSVADASLSALLLDSSLISRTNYNKHSIKIIECGDYIQVYKYSEKKYTKHKNIERMNNKNNANTLLHILYTKVENIKNVDTDDLCIQDIQEVKSKNKAIAYKNALRSKFQLQRLVKANENEFKTFITLTFADNITSVKMLIDNLIIGEKVQRELK